MFQHIAKSIFLHTFGVEPDRDQSICFATLAFVPQRQKKARYLPTPLVFPMISTHFTASPSVPVPYLSLQSAHILPETTVKPWALQQDVTVRLRNSLRPMNPDNACTLRITEASGTQLAGAYSCGTVIIFPHKRSLQPEGLQSSTRRRWIRLSSIVQYSRLLPSVDVWAVIMFAPIARSIRLYLLPVFLKTVGSQHVI